MAYIRWFWSQLEPTRFVLRCMEQLEQARIGHMMPISMWWLNAGVSPLYQEHWLALQFNSSSGSRTAEIPGDAVYDGSVYVDDSLAPGTYRLRVALLDPRTKAPAIRLAIEGLQEDGWYDLGAVVLMK